MRDLADVTLSHYQFVRRLARGGMADIYLACDTQNNEQVAIKMVHRDDGYCERFRQEIATMASLKHRHILPVLEYGEEDDWYYLVTPYIADGTLQDRLQKGRLTLDEAGTLLVQLASALQFAHEHGVIHRDIKPSNVLLKDGQHLYLADFGLVKQIGVRNNLTLSGYMIGTPDYMAPELADQDATPYSDIYALGILIYQALTGYVPFSGNTPIQVFLKHVRDEPERLSRHNPDVSNGIERVVLRAMAKKPHRRYTTALHFAQAYRRALEESHYVNIHQETLAITSPLMHAISQMTTRTSVPVPDQHKGRKVIKVGVGLLVICACITGLGAFVLRTPPPSVQGSQPPQSLEQPLEGKPTQEMGTETAIPTTTPQIPPPIDQALPDEDKKPGQNKPHQEDKGEDKKH